MLLLTVRGNIIKALGALLSGIQPPVRVIRVNKGISFLMKKVILLLSFFFIGLSHANYSDGYKAYEKGDYRTAFKEWKDLVGEDTLFSDFDFNSDEPKSPTTHSQAQYNLGYMYENGQGTLKNYQEALKYYERSARYNYGRAQLALVELKLRFLDGDLKHILTAEQKGDLREGWKELAEDVMILFNNEYASDELHISQTV